MATASTTSGGSDDDLSSRTQQSPLASRRAKEQQQKHPSAANRTGRFTQYFPLGYKDGFAQWWANLSPAAAEHAVLSFIPHLQKPPTHSKTGSLPMSDSSSSMPITDDAEHTAAPVTTGTNDPYGPRRWNSNLVQLNGKNRALNEFSVERLGESVEDNLVILHGYGAGLCFFYKNFEGLSRLGGWRLYALDLLGMGRSSRPTFHVKAKDQQGKINEAENWFIDALEEWRLKKKIDKFTLLGHSLGGYMAVAYALKYPGHLNKLILASPVGIPEDPYAINADMPEPEESTLQNEFGQDERDVIKSQSNPNIPDSAKVGDNNNFLNARSKAEAANGTAKSTNNKTTPNAPRRPLPKWLTYLWDANISPFSIVRWGGPLGPRFVSGWTSRRFSHLPPDEAQALHNYSYTLFKQRGSGEYALAYILAPGAFARSPLIRRIAGVGRQTISPSSSSAPASSGTSVSSEVSKPSVAAVSKEHGFPIVLMYGENDWMDVAGGYAAAEKLKEEKQRALKEGGDEAKRLERGESKVVVIKKAGHHVYLDGWEEFNEVIQSEMKDVTASRDGQR
ncbi:MAG: hypothetical protein M4579_003524 [Chaenotheca gracillima]|nr:MAG: hypothetical protein M4579_003524 [Chaenotheca gracillima]